MAHDLQQLFYLLARNSGQPDAWILRKANAAITWPQGEIAQNINRMAAAQVHGGVKMEIIPNRLTRLPLEIDRQVTKLDLA